MDAIVQRHPTSRPIPLLWQKLDPVIGSSLIFLLPCFALATIAPYIIRLETRKLAHVGLVSGWIIAASTIGSIAGVFVSGYLLLDHLRIADIFRTTGALTIVVGIGCLVLNRWLTPHQP